MLLVLGQLQPLAEVDHDAVDPGAGKPGGPGFRQQVLVRPLPLAGHRRQEQEARARFLRRELVDDLRRRLGAHFAATVVAIRRPQPREEDPQVVADFGHGADRRTGILADRLLLYGDGRAQPTDEVHLGFLHLSQELAGVGGKGFDIASLALGVECVESQRRLTGARDSGEDNQLAPRQAEVDPLEIVLLRAADNDELGVFHHRG